jgi:murein DD-endopeptidase MepM/ murein hydrolase activator NlpD
MNRQKAIFYLGVLVSSIILIMVPAGYAKSSESYQSRPFADLSGVDSFADNDQVPFRFPLDNMSSDTSPSYTEFCSRSIWTESKHMYHAAEDYLRPAGTPVYAMAEGMISFSGPMRGYGWLIIIDHPQANLYSLYGHLSPSRQRKRSGLVKKGDLIGYLGDSDENGGSAKHPLVPHLHLGVRAGQRSDYSSMGEWRWQAGWIKSYPPDLGWLQPSVIITSQVIPAGGFANPEAGFLEIWRNELLVAGIYVIGGVCMLFIAIKKDKPFVPVIFGVILFAAGILFATRKRLVVSYAVFAMAALSLTVGIYKVIRRSRKTPRSQDSEF